MDGTVLSATTVEELASLEVPALCDRFGLRLRADGDVQKDWKSIDVVYIDGEMTAALAEKIKVLVDVPVGLLCWPGPHLPDGVTLLHDASSVEAAVEERIGGEESVETIEKAIELVRPRLVLLKPKSQDGVTFLARRFMSLLTSLEAAKAIPAMFWFSYPSVPGQDEDAVVVRASSDFGSLFVDGLGEGILWEAEDMTAELLRESSFNLLQAARMRISKTEFISYPSCGRTLFNLQDTTKRIQDRTGHLPGVRIAVMGCIVNGPGEMADADFGYVGSGVGKIDLYVNYDCVKRGIPSADAVDKLVDLIKEHGRWQDPPEEGAEEEGEVEVVKAEAVEAVAAM